jgi:FkbM family methyltransferase
LLIAAAKYATCIFDIGANAGYYSLQFAKKYSSIKSVHAFEPIQKTYKTLLKNVNLNNLNKKIICQPFGLGDCDKKVEFYIPGFSGSVAASMENLHPEENNEVEMVNIITLDKYCIDNNISELDLMKIDVEGSESFVLKGAMASLNKFKPTIFIEILRKWSRMFGVEPNKNFHDLVKMGYECWAVQDGRLQAFTHMTEDTIQTNFFFIHADRKSEFNHLFN